MNKKINLLGKLITRKKLQDAKNARTKIKNRAVTKRRKAAQQAARKLV